jgi:hypothetical protein
MTKQKIYFFVIVLIFASAQGSAQDFRSLIIAMKKEFAESSSMEIVMNVSVFENKTALQPYFKQMVQIQKNAESYLYNFDEKEMFMNTNCMIIVDRQSRRIDYSKRDIKSEQKFRENIKFDLDSVLSLYGDVTLVENANGVEHYVVSQKKGPIAVIHFFIDSKKYVLKEIQYEYNEGYFVAISFLAFAKDPRFEPMTFSEDRFVQKVKGKIVPSRYYKNYSVSAR